MTTLAELLERGPFHAYTYAYPHKTAYRPIVDPPALRDLWAQQPQSALFLYIHIPFCEMRCGFCNLFTTTNPAQTLEQSYLATLRRQAERARSALDQPSFARMAIGGGTPTYLEPRELDALFELAERCFGVDSRAIPVSVETSPHTADDERLGLLRQRGVDRISIGVQSFLEHEARAAGRAQRSAEVEQALERIRHAGFPMLNIDLIYGLPGQSVASWLESLRAALRWRPEELYLYPLYVRPLTGLGRKERPDAQDIRLECYRAGRALLLEHGYQQVSMRMFRAGDAPASAGPAYCCQDDGMLGLGCGARSYTRALHYSSEYAVGAAGIRAILNDYIARPDQDFERAAYGFALNQDDQRRRYAIQSLLQADGLSLSGYQQRFGAAPFAQLPQLAELLEHGLARQQDDTLLLSERGLERSDTIGPWLYSRRVRALMEEYELR